MFAESSDLYDLIYSFKDYKKESEELRDVIKSKRPDCKTILDIACGTAEHHKYLKEYFVIDGIDLNENFIKQARLKNIQGSFSIADMSKFDLNKKYDVVICLFSSIGYLKTFDEIVLVLKCFNKHLNSDGLLILEPWFTADDYHKGRIGMTTYDKEDIKICRMTQSYSENEFSVLNFNYLVASIDKGVRHFTERHELRMTSKEEMFKAFKIAGFDVTYNEKGFMGRGMYYGIKN